MSNLEQIGRFGLVCVLVVAGSCSDDKSTPASSSTPASADVVVQEKLSPQAATLWLNGKEVASLSATDLSGGARAVVDFLPVTDRSSAWLTLKVAAKGGAGFNIADPAAHFQKRTMKFYILQEGWVAVGAFRDDAPPPGPGRPAHFDKPSTFVPKVSRVDVWTIEAPAPPAPPPREEITISTSSGKPLKPIMAAELAALEPLAPVAAAVKAKSSPKTLEKGDRKNRRKKKRKSLRWFIGDVLALRAPIANVAQLKVIGRDGSSAIVDSATLMGADHSATMRRNRKGELIFEPVLLSGEEPKKANRVKGVVSFEIQLSE